MIAIPPAIHAQFTQFLMEKPCATVYSKVVEVQFGPRHDCGRLTGKPEVGIPTHDDGSTRELQLAYQQLMTEHHPTHHTL